MMKRALNGFTRSSIGKKLEAFLRWKAAPNNKKDARTKGILSLT